MLYCEIFERQGLNRITLTTAVGSRAWGLCARCPYCADTAAFSVSPWPRLAHHYNAWGGYKKGISFFNRVLSSDSLPLRVVRLHHNPVEELSTRHKFCHIRTHADSDICNQLNNKSRGTNDEIKELFCLDKVQKLNDIVVVQVPHNHCFVAHVLIFFRIQICRYKERSVIASSNLHYDGTEPTYSFGW